MVPKLGNGPVEQMRVLLVVRRSARLQRSQSLNQLRHLVFCAPEPIRVRFKDRPQIGLVKEAAAMRPNPTSDPGDLYDQPDDPQRDKTHPSPHQRDERHRPDAQRARRTDRTRPLGPLRGRTRRSRHPPGHSRRQSRTDPLRTVMGPPLRSHPDPSILRQNHPTPAQPRR